MTLLSTIRPATRLATRPVKILLTTHARTRLVSTNAGPSSSSSDGSNSMSEAEARTDADGQITLEPKDPNHYTKTMADLSRQKSKKTLMDSDPVDRYSSAAWLHEPFDFEEMKAVPVAHHGPKTRADRFAKFTLTTIRKVFDKVTGYIHPPPGEEMNEKYKLSPEKWMTRFIFLESIAGVPGFVAAMVRHLHSLRLLRRDRAWIESLLEEAYNERMHLLTFIKMADAGWFMKTMLLGAQGVFFNGFFAAYLISPKTCHRFVGYLEEEAVVTYTRCIEDLEKGWYPEWEKTLAPDIALQYWHMPEGSTIKELLYYIRADECKHREVNHTLGNLNQSTDRNPFAIAIDNGKPQPSKGLKGHKDHPVGWDRDEIAA